MDAYENKLANFRSYSPLKKVVDFESPWSVVSASKLSLKNTAGKVRMLLIKYKVKKNSGLFIGLC